ncbi:MAG: DNA starvation/stationary phase protection protein [Acidimicrobiales bacterium]
MATTTKKKPTNGSNGANGSSGRAGTPGQFTIPGMKAADASAAVTILQRRLEALIDLTLTLKHVHWNVVGNGFIGVHEMLDPQYEAVALMVDATAERIAAMGGSPNGLAGSLVKHRTWDDYDLDRAVVPQHLLALDRAYAGVISSHREAVERMGDLDPVTEDMLIGQLGQLEGFQWFIRAHLENGDGTMAQNGPAPAARRSSK